jgi:PAS domain S-box-containing protein
MLDAGHQIGQNRRARMKDIVESKTDTHDYLEGLLEGFVAYDRDWRMTYMNAAAERMLNRQRSEVLGKTWAEAFPHAVGNPVDLMYRRVMANRAAERMELFYEHYGRWMEISASPLDSGGVAVYFRDTTDNETLNRIGKTLAAELDLERVVQAVTDAATELAGAQFGAFFYNVKNSAGESYMLYALSGVEREAFSKFPMPRNTAVFGPTFAGTAIVRSEDITKDPRYGKSAPHYGQPKGHLPVRSYLAVPVVSRSGEVLGGLFFGHERAGVFTERAERLVGGVASQAAIAIDNARLYGQLRESEERARLILERSNEAFVSIDDKGRICEWNPYAEKIFGWTRGEALGRSLSETVVPASLREAHEAGLRRFQETGKGALIDRRIEITARRKDGSEFPVEVTISPLRLASGQRVNAFMHDITARKRAEEELRRNERRLHRLMELMPAAVYTCDAQGRINFFNHRAAEIWGREPRINASDEKFHGSFGLYRPDGSPLAHADTPMAVAVRTGRPTHGEEVTMARPDGSRVVVTINSEPLYDTQGELAGSINVFQDITQRKLGEQELREADRRKDEFLAMLAHELRNPLAPIRHGLELLQRRPDHLPGDTVAMMQRQVTQLVRLVDDLLEVARISRGRIELQRARIDLRAPVRNALEAARPAIEAAAQALAVDLPQAPLHVNGDAVRLAQVVSNLLDNAAKYTEAGGRIALAVRHEGDEALISVSDNGIGIPAALLPQVFNLFGERAHASPRAQGGLGVGLGLARSLIQMHEGTIQALSDGPGKGTEIVIRLPLAPAPQGQATRRAASAPLRAPRGPRRVLVVDDNVDAAQMLGMLLEEMGHDVQLAYDGLAALEAARMNRPEIVLLDISMPGVDGLGVAQRLRQDPVFKRVPIIAVTGLGNARDRERSREAGFDEHLVKPVAPEVLRSMLERF